jgi:hypothetical protein
VTFSGSSCSIASSTELSLDGLLGEVPRHKNTAGDAGGGPATQAAAASSGGVGSSYKGDSRRSTPPAGKDASHHHHRSSSSHGLTSRLATIAVVSVGGGVAFGACPDLRGPVHLVVAPLRLRH